MLNTKKSYTCFLISGFRVKPLLRNFEEKEDFDRIYFELKAAVEGYTKTHPDYELEFKSSEDFAGAVITDEFYQQLFASDLVIAELSAVSPNVFYELGVRLALRPSATLLFALEGTPLPFDLKDLRVVFYQVGKLKDKYFEIYRLMEARLNGVMDSPIFSALPNLRVLSVQEIEHYQHRIQELEEDIRLLRIGDKALELLDGAKQIMEQQQLDKNDIFRALSLMKQAYTISPRNFRVVFAYGKLLHAAQNYDEAISKLTEAVHLNELDESPLSEPYKELGLAYRRRATLNNDPKDYNSAREFLKKAIRINSQDDDAWGILGGLHKRLDEVEDAIASYQRGLEINPNSTYCLTNELMLRIILKGLNIAAKPADNVLRIQRISTIADALFAAQGTNTVDYWDIVNKAETWIYLERTQDGILLYEQATQIVDTPDKLQSALDNLNYVKAVYSLLPGLEDAIRILSNRIQEFSH
jgi:tetratricopeptide (TPR) repeat protein